ncbi:thioredoxin fold domain-containing protein [Mucilaginibacter calamicampi]|uniref:Thioredoxin fold domain-containing protein n=1 Tax=Mucilaginibacter calamicampi TaxID=1302352 RepID=A0ABW2YX13_9SPHI
MKKIFAGMWLLILAVAIASLFWYNDLKYRIPTPVPIGYQPVAQGQLINLPVLKAYDKKPVLLHFFNPACPCSRFNIRTVKALIKQYGSEVNFIIVVISNKPYTVSEIQDKFGSNLPVLFNGIYAKTCGVYSTPQAVLLDPEHRLNYRGNYNSSRYCTDEKTAYAKIAINEMLANNTRVKFSQFALRAYGCQLPNCNKN